MTATTKDLLRRMLAELPDDAEIEDVIEELYFLRTLQLRLEGLESADTVFHEEARRRMDRWLT